MKTLVAYYSGNGSNRFLAEKTASDLDAQLVELVPRVKGLVIPATFLKIGFGNRNITVNPASYDSIIVCGPIYMGNLAAPCYHFIRKFGKSAKTLNVITCCASKDSAKDETFGYNRLFTKLRGTGMVNGICQAFPVELVVPADQQSDDEVMMNTRLSEENFNGEIHRRHQEFIAAVSA